ncbi:MAG TPA: glycoside hydrolase family 78 protein [Bryobacteraceae bacterium]|nr:glycoside hydrolase family 78 protein [Bryobacteraceae bacterium]
MRKLVLVLSTVAGLSAAPVRLRCEHLNNPLGIDSERPLLSWQSESKERNWRQAAYQILVASSPGRLHKADVWDSGKQASGESNGIAYGGPKLESRRRYYWTVRVWDARGKRAEPSQPAWWEMGLLSKDDWKAKWISRRDLGGDADHAATSWIWVAGQDAFHVPAKTAGLFRLNFDLAQKPAGAELLIITRGSYDARVNGHEIGTRRDSQEFDRLDLGDQLTTGANTVEVRVIARGAITALAALLKITRSDGATERIPTDRWQARLESETVWKPAAAVAELNDKRLGDPSLEQSAALLRRSFSIAAPVRTARLYITALGSYRVFLNGQRVGNDILTPDWTDYRKRVLYQTYDVTSMLARGGNAIGAILGDGWYGSGLGSGQRFNFGPPPVRLIAQLEIEDTKGHRQTIVSDESWRAAQSPILRSEIYAGENYDARLEQPGWNTAGFQDARWTPAAISAPPPGAVSSQMSPTIQVTETLRPKNITSPSAGVSIFDMGQNMVGWVRLKASGPAGTKIRLRFVEILKPDGSIYRDNLRGADATDTFILRGGGEETFEPHFTYHGFRYVEVTGYPGNPTLDAITGQVFHTALEFTGKFTSSSAMVNQLWLNTLWGQRGNLESVPTDCPQRDERLGWMGDAQIFWRTASYNMDMAAFTHKWMRDVVEAQSPEGGFADVSPRVMDLRDGAPAWGDAGVIVPWTAWRHYGDTRVIEENWDAMERWMRYIGSENPEFIREKRRNNDFGDWVPAESTTPKDLIATAYWAYDASLMSQMARAVGKEADAKRYADLFDNVRAAFQKKFIHENGEVGNGSQTCYALALHMNLARDDQKPALMERLVHDIEARNWHLSTGFLGTPYLLAVLVNNGRADVAYRLLLNETYPSWGYMIGKGATTIWERWNGDRGDPGMNSFNHYAFGSVVEWLYRYAAGIDTAADSPGFRNIVIHPRPDARLSHVRGEYDSVYGKIVSDWNGAPGGPFSLRVTIPANTTATVYLPTGRVTESGKPVDTKPGPPGYVTCAIGSGSYDFQVN